MVHFKCIFYRAFYIFLFLLLIMLLFITFSPPYFSADRPLYLCQAAYIIILYYFGADIPFITCLYHFFFHQT